MIDLLNDLTVQFVWKIDNYLLGFVDLKFQVLPTMGTTVASTITDWTEFQATFDKENSSTEYNAIVGKSKADVWTLILGEWAKYKVDPNTSANALRMLFDYVNSVGVKI